MMERLLCGNCRKLLRYKDQVYLDRLNTVIHQRCYRTNVDVKDKGTLHNLMTKYNFF